MPPQTHLFFLHIAATGPPTTGAVKSCLPDGSQLRTLVSGLGTHPDGIAVDAPNGHIYYSNMGADPAARDGSIMRVDVDGANGVEVLGVPEGAGRAYTPKQMIIVGGEAEGKRKRKMLYWCDREGGRVWRANMDGANPECLYISGPRGADLSKDEENHCVGIAVDTQRKLILWTQKGPSNGGKGRLFRAGLDVPPGETPGTRTDVKVLMDHLPEPIDLELDAEANLLYKTDRGAPPRGNTVSRVHLDRDGEVVEEILVRHLHDAIGVTLDKKRGKMYFTDIGGSVYESGLDGEGTREVLSGQGDLTGIWCVEV